MEIDLGKLLALALDLRHPVETAEQRYERRLHFEDNGRTGRGHQRDIAAELDGVAEALLGMEQDGLAGKIFCAESERCGKIAPCRRELIGLPAPLEFRPAAREIAAQQAA